MAHLRSLARHSSRYFTGNLLVVLAGMVSLPIWTRLLSLEQYGLFALFNVSIAFLVAFSKLGLQHASLRFYSEFRARNDLRAMVRYYSTMVLGGALLCTGTAALAVVVARAAIGDPALRSLLVPAGVVVVAQSLMSLLMVFLRAEQESRLYGVLMVARRYGGLACAIVAVLVLGAGVRSILIGWIVAGGLIVAALLLRMLHRGRISPTAFSPRLMRSALVYGFPMIWMELSNSTLALGDRYVLQYFLGAKAVGVYSVGYNTAAMAKSILAQPLRIAVVPMFLALWSQRGEDETRTFLGQTLRYYLMLAVPLALGVSWYGREIVSLLATTKFVEAASIVPLVVIPLVLHGAYSIYGAGLYIHKKTGVLMQATLLATVLNIGLNLVLVPRFGIPGAAWSTLVAYLLLVVLIWVRGRRLLPVRLDVQAIGKFALLALAATFAGSALVGREPILLTIGVVIAIYGALLLIADRDLRDKALGLVGAARSQA